MQDQKKHTGSIEIELTEAQALEYSRKLEQFEEKFPKMQEEFLESKEKNYFLVSCKFIKEWKNFCRDTGNSRQQPEPMNADIVDSQSKQLLNDLVEGENFQIVNKRIYEFFEGFPVYAELRRVAYGQQKQKRVPLQTLNINYLTLTQKDLHQYDRKAKLRQNLKLSQLSSVSQNNTTYDLISEIESIQMISRSYTTRIWKHAKQTTLDVFYNHIITCCKPLSYDLMKIKALGKKLQNVDDKLGELNIQQGQYFVLQCIEHDKVVITGEDEGKCESCYLYKKLPFPCGCKQVAYCSQNCYDNDRKYHVQRCKLIEEQQMKKAVEMNMRERSRRGLVGLENLGNTCFMNSCLQCLSHTLPLTQYFLEKKYADEINHDNPIGSKGKLAQAYATFIKNMWCEEESVYRPYRLKSAIADINKMFSGYAQHDSQQLFSFLVDGLHEDLNRIKQKPYVQSVDSNGRSDDIVSREGWLAYIKRNQSIISDHMVGQYKSKVVCPDCGKQSITFDPFITVTLPIPEKSSSEMKLYVLYGDYSTETIRVNIFFKQKSVEQIYKKVSDFINLPTSNFRLYVLSFEQNIYPFDTTPKTQLFSKIDNLSSSIFAIELTAEDMALKNKIELTCRFSKKEFSKYESFWFKRPFFFDYQTTTALDITKRVLKYLYNDTYDFSESRIQKQKNKVKWRKSSQEQNTAPKTYEQYEAIMLKKRPFKVLLRSDKKIKTTYSSNIETEFKQEKLLEDDEKISDLILLADLDNFEIDIRFVADGLEDFTVSRLRNYTDKTKDVYGSKMDDEEKNVSLDQCFEALETPEQLEKGNEWYCSQCKDHKLATKQMYIYKTPDILILHFKRFKVKGIIRRQKNEANVDFPYELNMSKYIVSNDPINAYIPYVQSQNLYATPSYDLHIPEHAPPIYELYAVSNHYGSLGGGHYTAYAKNGEKWYSFNDSSVSCVDESRVKGSGAYILFYRRKTN